MHPIRRTGPLVRRPSPSLSPKKSNIQFSDSSDSYSDKFSVLEKPQTKPTKNQTPLKTQPKSLNSPPNKSFTQASALRRKIVLVSSDSYDSDSEEIVSVNQGHPALLHEVSSDDDPGSENLVLVEKTEIVNYSPYQNKTSKKSHPSTARSIPNLNEYSNSLSNHEVDFNPKPGSSRLTNQRSQQDFKPNKNQNQIDPIRHQSTENSIVSQSTENSIVNQPTENSIISQPTENSIINQPTENSIINQNDQIQSNTSEKQNLDNNNSGMQNIQSSPLALPLNNYSTASTPGTPRSGRPPNGVPRRRRRTDSDYSEQYPDETPKLDSIGKPNEQLFTPRPTLRSDTLPCFNIGWNKSLGRKTGLHMTLNDKVIYFSKETKTEIGKCHIICTNHNLDRYSSSYVGSLKKSDNLARFTLYVPAGEQYQTQESEMMGLAFYDYKDVKHFRGRTFRLTIPKSQPYFPANKSMNLSRLALNEVISDDIYLFKSKLPVELPNNTYRLDFGSVYVVSSIKNFIVEDDNHNVIFMIYKSSSGICSVRFANPINSLMAFCLAIAVITSQK